MEQAYRRSTPYIRRQRTQGALFPKGSFKKMVLKQTAVCCALLAVGITLKTSPAEELHFARQAVQFTLNNTTDFRQVWDNAWSALHDRFTANDSDNAQENQAFDPVADMEAPLAVAVSSPFGMRMHPVEQVEKFHYGVDLAAPEGEKIKCVASGEAVEAGTDETYGNYLLVKHSDEIYSFYAHCQRVLAGVGDQIDKGQVIATVGSTGETTGSHLHFEIRNGDTSLDPETFIHFEAAE